MVKIRIYFDLFGVWIILYCVAWLRHLSFLYHAHGSSKEIWTNATWFFFWWITKKKWTFVLLWCLQRVVSFIMFFEHQMQTDRVGRSWKSQFQHQTKRSKHFCTHSPPVSTLFCAVKFTYLAIAHVDSLGTALKYRVSQVSIHLAGTMMLLCVLWRADTKETFPYQTECAMSVRCCCCCCCKWQFPSQPLSVCTWVSVFFSPFPFFSHFIFQMTMMAATTTTKVRKLTSAPFKWTINALFAPANEIWFVKQHFRFVAN